MALRPGLVEELVPVQTGWFADENVFDMQIERYRPHRSARRFDAGTPPVPNIYAGVAGVGLIAEAGVPAIAEHVRGLVERLVAGLDELGATVAAPPHGPLVCIRSTDAPALVASLAEEDIVASERDSNLRVSLHLYNTDDDVDAVLAALASAARCSPSSASRRGIAERRARRGPTRAASSPAPAARTSAFGTKRERSTSCKRWM